jgi:HEAT repeat protein
LATVVPAKIAVIAPECDMPAMRMARLRAWSRLGQIETIIAAAQSDKDFNVRRRAVEILGELRHPAAIEPLAQLLRDEDKCG